MAGLRAAQHESHADQEASCCRAVSSVDVVRHSAKLLRQRVMHRADEMML